MNSIIILILYIAGIFINGYTLTVFILKFKYINGISKYGIWYLLGIIELFCLLYLLTFFSLLNYSKLAFYFLTIFNCMLLTARPDRLKLIYASKSDIKPLTYTLLLFFIFLFPNLFKELIAWDAIAIWLTKARVFYFENSIVNNFFLLDQFKYAHQDYPLGIPLTTSLLYRLINGFDNLPTILFLSTFILPIFLTIGDFISSFQKHKLIMITFSLILFFNIFSYFYSISGYVDSILGVFIGISVFLSLRALTIVDIKEKTTTLLMSIIFAAGTCFIKNEGFTYFIFFMIANLGIIYIYNKNYSRELFSAYYIYIATIMILIAVLVSWILIKKIYNINNDIFAQYKSDNLNFYFKRFEIIVEFFFKLITSDYLFGVTIAISAFAFLYSNLFLTINKLKPLIIINMIIILQVLVYVIIYLITPYDIKWHITNSMSRLCLHLLPALFFCIVFNIYQTLVRKDSKASVL